MPAAETYPDDLRYHPEHDWARVEGDEAILESPGSRRTRWASSSTKAPATGSTVAKDESYGEVESVKAVSDIVAPLSGRSWP